MSLGHLSISLTHYGAFYRPVYRGHAAGTKTQPTQTIKHSSGNTSQGQVAAVNYCFVHMRKAVAGVCIGRVRQGQHQIAHIHSQMQPLHVPGTWSRSQILFHTYERKCSRHFYMELTAGKRIYTHTVATAVIVCPRDMYPQGVPLSEFFVPHDFTPMFCHCNMSRQSSFGRTLCGMLQQRMLQKGRFLSCEQLRSVCLQLYYRFNQSQTANKRQYNTFMLMYLR